MKQLHWLKLMSIWTNGIASVIFPKKFFPKRKLNFVFKATVTTFIHFG